MERRAPWRCSGAAAMNGAGWRASASSRPPRPWIGCWAWLRRTRRRWDRRGSSASTRGSSQMRPRPRRPGPSSTRASPSNGATPSWRPCRCSSRYNKARPTRPSPARTSTCTASRSRRRGRRTRRSPASPAPTASSSRGRCSGPSSIWSRRRGRGRLFSVSFSAVVRLLRPFLAEASGAAAYTKRRPPLTRPSA